MVPKKSPRIPLELHQIKAYEFYQQRLASGKEGNEIDDWQQAKEYLSQHPRAILAWNLKMPYRGGKRLIKRLLLSLQSLVRVAWKLLIFPFWLFQQIPGLFAREDKDSRTFAIDVVKTIISALGLIATLLAGLGLVLNYSNSQAEMQLTQQRLITERFSKAVEQIGNTKEEVVIGGIYSLERIAKDSPKDQWTIMEVLTSYIRKNSPIPSNIQQLEPEEREKALEKLPSVSIPVQAALTVIGRRKVENDQAGDNLAETTDSNKIKILDLSRTNLREANLNGANLDGANLNGANLNGANLNRANLNRAYLNGAYLNRAELYRANLKGANLWVAYLNGAYLNGAELIGAELIGAELIGAELIEAELNRANLYRANLYRAILDGADLNRANLNGANLNGANLNGAEGLNPEQIKSACFWEKAIYTESKWDEDTELWVAADPKANQREIDKLKRDKNSDMPNPIDCNTK
ncbi:MAG: pentapeptide repeat-containing protein [Microcystis aeruginosa Ma_MB_F_20061100_S19]|uniref:Type III effector pipB2 n=1 Tax=Microcystis aeruginosa SPC777 TaxID=482300 RepID=S3K3J6_MICAE|nr:pentapeptide repeat-containing protein [Microcystis aeruginosa]EPF19694.1 Type III effector pipB2 [Microcystis aeruginosa SPC777]NCR98767.1 pentapeptide repeat-containing protein [Microcystis aeruginosa L311-01]TRU08974.1 MAG: pentapeptide repeat-containing protein [Microcystis aeruginosa Ma_MB_F_20061100_S19D]TRU12898.1 MAG: pentapeptide repeat-containing protein [Microcystis aeruginosa Ma_MB_F_20061100_S19]